MLSLLIFALFGLGGLVSVQLRALSFCFWVVLTRLGFVTSDDVQKIKVQFQYGVDFAISEGFHDAIKKVEQFGGGNFVRRKKK